MIKKFFRASLGLWRSSRQSFSTDNTQDSTSPIHSLSNEGASEALSNLAQSSERKPDLPLTPGFRGGSPSAKVENASLTQTTEDLPGSTESFIPLQDKKEILSRIYQELRGVVDPEIGINVIDLGLVYEVLVQEKKILIRMGLTTPFCPYGPELLRAAEVVVRNATGFPEVEVEYVLDPPWNPSMMSPEARMMLGMD